MRKYLNFNEIIKCTPKKLPKISETKNLGNV